MNRDASSSPTPTPTPSPSPSSSLNASSLLKTFEMDSFSSLENGRLLKNRYESGNNVNSISNNSVGSTFEKNNILSNWQKSKANKTINNHTKLTTDNQYTNKFAIIEDDITETSDIISNGGLHKSLQSLPEEPVSKLMNNTVEESLMNLKLVTIEKEKLKRSNKSLMSKNEELKRQVDSLQHENSSLLNQIDSLTNSKISSSSNSQNFTIESLVKKLQKYKFISQEQEIIIKDLKQQLEIALLNNSKNQSNESYKTQQQNDDELQQGDISLDNTDFLLSMNGGKQSQDFQSSTDKSTINNEIQKSQTINYNVEKQKNLDQQNKKTSIIQEKSNQELTNDTKEKQNDLSDELNIIKTMVQELKPLLEYVSTSNTMKTNKESIDSSLADKIFTTSKISDKQDINEPRSSANDFLKSLSEKVDKKKKLQKELVDLENDEYIKMIERISNPIDLSQKDYGMKPLRVGDLLLDEQDFINLLKPKKRKQKNNVDLQTLKSLNKNIDSDTWIEDSYDYEDDNTTDNFLSSDLNKSLFLDDVLQSTKAEFTELINKFNTLYHDTLSTDPAHNFKANKRSIHVLSDLLQQINKKRQLIYKISQNLKMGIHEPTFGTLNDTANLENKDIDTQLVW